MVKKHHKRCSLVPLARKNLIQPNINPIREWSERVRNFKKKIFFLKKWDSFRLHMKLILDWIVE